jgi:hypothetical protein
MRTARQPTGATALHGTAPCSPRPGFSRQCSGPFPTRSYHTYDQKQLGFSRSIGGQMVIHVSGNKGPARQGAPRYSRNQYNAEIRYDCTASGPGTSLGQRLGPPAAAGTVAHLRTALLTGCTPVKCMSGSGSCAVLIYLRQKDTSTVCSVVPDRKCENREPSCLANVAV